MKKRMLLPLALMGVLAGSTMGNGGCGEHDTKIEGSDSAPATRINFPNHFSTVAHKCDGLGHRVYEGDHGDSSNGGGWGFVIVDPTCPGGPAR